MIKYIGYISNLSRAAAPIFENMQVLVALKRASSSLSFAQYRGFGVTDELGIDLSGVIALSSKNSYIELLAVDNKSLKKGGRISVVVDGITYTFNYFEIHA